MQSPSSTLDFLLSALGTSTAGHAVFSRRGGPLLLLPKDKIIAAATMGLYRPQSAKAKIAAAAVRMLCRLGLHGIALPKVPSKSDETGVLICNPCHGTRVIVVRRAADGRLEILKAAVRENSDPIRREHAILEHLGLILNHETHEKFSDSNHLHMGMNMEAKTWAGVPMVGPLVERDDAVWFSMPYLSDAPRDIDPVPLLQAWESEKTEPAEENGLIRDLFPLLDEQTRAALADSTVRRALVHGDFAPWNWRLAPDENHETHKAHETAGSRLLCIDWEWAREDGFAGFDLVYCLVQQALLVKKVPETRLVEFVRQAVSNIGQGPLGGQSLPIETLVALVLAYRKSKRMDPSEATFSVPTSPTNDVHSKSGVCESGSPLTHTPKFLAIEGADGVGKSTVLRLLLPELVRRGGYTGYLFFHWKPVKGNLSYDSIPGDNPHDPRGKRPRSPLASLVFLAHHWLDFQIGYWRFIRPTMRAGQLVVADRYTYDVLLDPKRFRLRLPAWILRLFVLTVPRPQRAILLHADPTVIRARKPELTEFEIAAYQSALLSCRLIRSAMPVDAGRTPDEIVAKIVGTRPL